MGFLRLLYSDYLYRISKIPKDDIMTKDKMDRLEAIEILREFGDEQVKDIYDVYDDATDALHVICSPFDYPTWDYYTVAGFLKANGHII